MARIKASYQVLLALATAAGLYYFLDLSSVAIPGRAIKLDLGLFYIPAAVFVIVAMSNAVNLTDGLDGLAGSTVAVAFAAYGIIAHLQGQYPLSSFCFTMVGALVCVSLVQLPPGPALHGRHRLARTRSYAWPWWR